MAEHQESGTGDSSTRGRLVHKAVIFQLKLMADGLRDLVLMPVSLFATFVGLVRGGDEPQREFDQVIELGRNSEQWINLFGNHDPPDNAHTNASIDTLLTHVEDVLKQQYKESEISKRAREKIDVALQAAHEKARTESPEE